MVSLKNYNTFGVDVIANEVYNISSFKELQHLIKSGKYAESNPLILGGGSNILFTGNYEGTIYRAASENINIKNTSEKKIHIECDAGIEWDSFVEFCVNNNYGGLENLSYIPGRTGAAPIQNIGAYGAEICQAIEMVNALDLETGEKLIFNNKECQFGYRTSIFKNELKGKVFITSVVFSLSLNKHLYNTAYGQVEQRLSQLGKTNLKNIRDAIIGIRKEKLPEPLETGNAGSFFKNPMVTEDVFTDLADKFKTIPSYPAGTGYRKLPAAWLIEKCGWKGYRDGDAGVHKNQALVLINYGSATGLEILKLSEEIIKSVNDKFGIVLEREVNVD